MTDYLNRLEALIVKHEGLRLKPYTDTTGHLTIGVGRNLTDLGIREEEAVFMLKNDIADAFVGLSIIFPDFADYSEDRQIAMIDMMFNLGRSGFLGFKKMIQAVRDKDWDTAAWCMRNSLWYQQVPERAEELAEMIQNGAQNGAQDG